jgi:hypothetical protein
MPSNGIYRSPSAIIVAVPEVGRAFRPPLGWPRRPGDGDAGFLDL